MPRSGTTLIEQILASHPQVHAAGELANLDRLVCATLGTDEQMLAFGTSPAALAAADYQRLGRSYLDSLPPLPAGKTRITDKMPANFFYIGLIRLILPHADHPRHARRQRDTCLSCYAKHFASGQGFSYDLAELGRYHRLYQRLMSTGSDLLPERAMLDVAYERVVDDLEGEARRLVEFCGLSWDERCLSFHQTSRAIATPSNVQVRRPVYRSSLERWRRYEAYLGPLLAELESGQTGE